MCHQYSSSNQTNWQWIQAPNFCRKSTRTTRTLLGRLGLRSSFYHKMLRFNYNKLCQYLQQSAKATQSLKEHLFHVLECISVLSTSVEHHKQLLTMIATILAPCENFSRRFEQIWLHHEDSNVSCKNLAKRSARLQGHCSAVLRFNSAASHRSMRPQTKPNGECPRAVALVTCLVPLDPFGSLNT